MEEGLWLSVSDLAAQRGMAKQTLSERAARFEAKGLLRTRPGKGRAKLINVAEFDRACGASTDVVRALNGGASLDAPKPPAETEKADPSASEVLTRENARRAAYTADLAKLELDERLGKLVALDDIVSATVRLGDKIVRQIDQLPTRAEEFAVAVAKDGSAGARAMLKKFAFDLREGIARELAALATPGASAETQEENEA